MPTGCRRMPATWFDLPIMMRMRTSICGLFFRCVAGVAENRKERGMP